MRQVAAFPYRSVEGSLELLLVTSSNGRWIIPKGDVDEGMAPHLAAEKEAARLAGRLEALEAAQPQEGKGEGKRPGWWDRLRGRGNQ